MRRLTARREAPWIRILCVVGALALPGCSGRKAPEGGGVSARPTAEAPAPPAPFEVAASPGGRLSSGDIPLGGEVGDVRRFTRPADAAGPGPAGRRGRRGGGRAGGGDPGGLPPEVLALFADIRFEFDSAALTAAARAQLTELGTYLLEDPGLEVLVEGHCDERGDAAYNLTLGEKRALTVREFLVAMRVAPARVQTVSYGEERPADRGYGEAAWAKNRRARFRVRRR